MPWGRKTIRSLRFQIAMAFIGFTVIIILMIVGSSFFFVSSSERESAVARALQSSEQVGMEAKVLINEVTKILQWGQSNDAYQFLKAEGDKHVEALSLIEDMSMYRESSLIDKAVKNVYLIGNDKVAYDERRGVYEINRYEKSRVIYELVNVSPDLLIYVKGTEIRPSDEDFILYGTAILQPATKKVIGYAAIEFEKNVFDDYVSKQILGDSGTFAIVDENGQFISGGNTLLTKLSNSGQLKFVENENKAIIVDAEGNEVLLVYETIPHTNWYLANCVYVSELTKNTTIIMRAIYLSAILVSVVCIFIFIYISARLTKPIVRLKEKMLMVEAGNLDAQITELSHNEFRTLETQYNHMLAELKTLIKNHIDDQKNLQKAEFKALQSQIAPHFLYNTLDTIIWLVAVNKNEEAIEMIENLSIFFKTGLSRGMDWISVNKEIEHVKSYLNIQQSRYHDILTYSLVIDSALCQYDMLKMTLQPIVENAIHHGIKNKENGGSIAINGFIEDAEYMVFDIIDTGVGMEEEIVEKLNQAMKENILAFEDNENGFGLYNVNRRIRLYYGDPKCGLEVSSQLGKWTNVRIRLKMIQGKERDV